VHEIPNSARWLKIAWRVTARANCAMICGMSFVGHFLWDAAPTEIALCDFGILSAKSAVADLAAPPAEMRGRQ
jgi:hypothetical protein